MPPPLLEGAAASVFLRALTGQRAHRLPSRARTPSSVADLAPSASSPHPAPRCFVASPENPAQPLTRSP